MVKIKYIAVAGVAAILLYACKHEIPAPPVAPPAATVCFESEVLPLFQSNCAKSGCHDAATASDGYILDSYANIRARGIIPGDSSGSQVYKALAGNGVERMPQDPNNPLSTAQIHTIATWIQEGASNTVSCEGSCDSSRFAYSTEVVPILQTHCLGCHNGLAIDGGFIPLDTYDGVLQQVNNNALLAAVMHTGTFPMPKNGDQLSECKIAIIRKWIAAGAPDN